jgi:hypothetical protein
MATCPKLAEGEVVRLTRVDGCGAPEEGDDNGFVDDCWSSVAMAPNVEAGTDIDFRAMNGSSCGFKRGRSSFRGYDITGSFYSASPEMIELLTGNPLYLDWEGNPIGWDDCAVAVSGGFALEIWQNIVGEDCPEDGDALYWYWLMPWIENGTLGDVTVSEEGVTFTLTGNTRSNGRWEHGPWDVQAQDGIGTEGPLLTAVGSSCHRRSFLTTIAPPTAECGYITVPANNPGT